MLAKLLAISFQSFMMKESLLILEIVLYDRVDVVRKQLTDLIFLCVDLILNIFDAVFSRPGSVLYYLLYIIHELIYHMQY